MDKQMIEEMAKDIFDYARTLVDIKTATEDSVFVNRYIEAVKGYAKYLVNAGYRKIHENAVVLTMEEWEKYQTTQRDWNAIYFDGIEQVRKGTAEKFAEMAKAKAIKARVNIDDHPRNDSFVFLNDIDEICKELSEGE